MGSVLSSELTLRTLVAHKADVVGVLAHKPVDASKVSGYADLAEVARELGVANVLEFVSANDSETVEFIRQAMPDVLFVVGFSQLVGPEILEIPRLGCVGFHPSRLPQGRGRAPLAWLIDLGLSGAATFFELTEGADEGGVFVQEPFAVFNTDHADDVYDRTLNAMRVALHGWLPQLLAGVWNPVPQSQTGVSLWGRRGPRDALIEWEQSARRLDSLIRAASPPHPGAFTYYRDRLVRVVRSHGEVAMVSNAFPGTVLGRDEQGRYIVQAGDRALSLSLSDEAPSIRVGVRLGYVVQNEIFDLRHRLNALEARQSRTAPREA